jgi:hypothetical protein
MRQGKESCIAKAVVVELGGRNKIRRLRARRSSAGISPHRAHQATNISIFEQEARTASVRLGLRTEQRIQAYLTIPEDEI